MVPSRFALRIPMLLAGRLAGSSDGCPQVLPYLGSYLNLLHAAKIVKIYPICLLLLLKTKVLLTFLFSPDF